MTTFLRLLPVVVFLVTCTVFSAAKGAFLDDFEDGNIDAPPVQWTPSPDRPGGYDASSGDFVLSPTPDTIDTLLSGILNLPMSASSVRVRLLSTGTNGTAGVLVRQQDQPGEPQAYSAGIGYFPDFAGGSSVFFITHWAADGEISNLGFDLMPLDVRSQDMMLQLDAFDNELTLWVWPVGETMPNRPSMVSSDDSYSTGTLGVFFEPGDDGGQGIFRFVQAADVSIRDGDLNVDNLVNSLDIDHINSAIQEGSSSAFFDLDGSMVVDLSDTGFLVTSILETDPGDADLNGLVTASGDGAVLLSNLGAPGPFGWADGNFTGHEDSLVTASADGAILLENLSGDTTAIPEPGSFVLVVVFSSWALFRQRPATIARRASDGR